MPKLFRRDGGDQIVEGAQLVLAAEVEALEHVVSERGHLTVLAAQQFLESGGGIGILPQGRRQFDLQLVDAQEHSDFSSWGHSFEGVPALTDQRFV